MGLFGFLFGRKKKKQIKIGLALGSGGAKGFAELGALSAFEQNNIAFDVVAGTSIGSIIGAFYADGYSSTDIMELLKKIDFGELANMLMMKIDTAKVAEIIDKNIGEKNIEELNKPFFAVATELDTGDETVFKSGQVATALCASSSYPPFFKPVIIDGKRFIDGAFSNSVPADVLKGNGADYVVAIDLSSHEPKSASMLDKIFPTYKGKIEKPWEKGYEYADVMIHPDLKAFKPTSFAQGSVMYEIGYLAAMEKIPKIKADIELLKKGRKKRDK